MLETMFEVTRNIVVLLIIFSLLEMFLPRGEFRPFLNMVIGLVLMLTLLGPLLPLGRLPVQLELPAAERQTPAAAGESLSRLEQLNQDLTLLRYRELLAGKIREVLQAEGFTLLEYSLEMEEAPEHPAFGRLLAVRVLAKETEAAPPVRKVPEIRVSIEAREPARQQEGGSEVRTAGVQNRRLASLLAGSLGLAEEKITVLVL